MNVRTGSILFALVFLSVAVLLSKVPSCVESQQEVINRGISLSGVVEDGEKVVLEKGECPIRRGDIVAYNYGGSDVPIIKIVYGVPRDKFSFERRNGYWELLINGKAAENSRGEPYRLGESQHNMLSLYEKDYGGVIPANAYLILGNLAGGSVDSTRFGLVDKSDFLGRIRTSIW